MNAISKSGYVAIIGRPNVGKSSLLNTLVGAKISIISAKPQTTRHQILGIKNFATAQAVFIDTPGLHKAEKRAMNRYLNRLASSVITDADVILFMVNAKGWVQEDEMVLERLLPLKKSVILVINKIDKIKDKSTLLLFIDKIKNKYPFKDIVPISAIQHENILALEKVIQDALPIGPALYPLDQVTDKSLHFQAAEFIREKLIRATEEELPYSTTVTIDTWEKQANLLKISAIIWVERTSQKPIVIGKDGERLKRIGTLARKDIETLVGSKVFLRLWVKVKSDWTDDASVLQNLLFTL